MDATAAWPQFGGPDGRRHSPFAASASGAVRWRARLTRNALFSSASVTGATLVTAAAR